jgi:hypothetical protein
MLGRTYLGDDLQRDCYDMWVQPKCQSTFRNWRKKAISTVKHMWDVPISAIDASWTKVMESSPWRPSQTPTNIAAQRSPRNHIRPSLILRKVSHISGISTIIHRHRLDALVLLYRHRLPVLRLLELGTGFSHLQLSTWWREVQPRHDSG